MGFASQLKLLLWKNWLLQKRRICISVFEVILPVAFALLIVFIRSLVNVDTTSTITTYPPKSTIMNASQGMEIFPENLILGFAPNNTETANIMQNTYDLFVAKSNVGKGSNIQNCTLLGFDDEDSAVTYFQSHSNVMRLVIIFDGVTSASTSLPKDLSYSVRPYTGDTRWRTKQTYPFIQENGPRDDPDRPPYYSKGVLLMQTLVGEAVTRYWYVKDKGGNVNDINIDLSTNLFAYPPYNQDPIIGVLQQTLPFLIVLSFILSVIVNTKNLVYEKEKKLKESMKLMGLKASVHWISWFITFMVYIVPAVAVYALLLGLNIIEDKGPVLANTDVSLFFVFLLLYSVALVTFCFMVSTFVQKANIAAALSGILFFAFYFPYYFVQPNYEELSKTAKLSSGLLFNAAMALGANIIGLSEGTGEGAHWSNFHKPATVDDNVSLLEVFVILIVDSVLHLLITWYLDNVRPGDFGIPKRWYFCFTKSYWCGSSRRRNSNYDPNQVTNKRFEKEPVGGKAGIQIQNLRKTFGKKEAVFGTSLNMFEGQISVLLGHNGAGKTTTMSMLTGFLPPSSGTALVNGYDIVENIDGVRSSLGLCPQHDILFDTMTVHEHLEFFAELKGSSGKNIKTDVIETAKEVGLETKIYERSASLSGGQKRKLSVGIALIGGSKVVILDEPTSGMDPGARRQTWNVLQRAREGRTVLLSTHYMDEADLLGDRIAIMAEGVVKCCGTSLFLKKLYGAGYHLVVVKDSRCDVNVLTEFIQSFVDTAELETVINQEVSYILPDHESSKFPTLFRDLDRNKEKLGITSYGTSATTMEEVFLKVGDSAYDEEDYAVNGQKNSVAYTNQGFENGLKKPIHGIKLPKLTHNKVDSEKASENGKVEKDRSVADDVMAFNKGYEKKTGLALELSRIHGLFVKKMIHTWRNRVVTLVQLLLPVIFTILGLLALESAPQGTDDPALTFNIDPFDDPIVPYTSGLSPSADGTRFGNMYAAQFGSGVDTDYVDISTETFNNWTVAKAESLGISTFKRRVIVGMQLSTPNPTAGSAISAIAFFNGQPYHARPVAVNYVMNTFLQYYMNSSSYSLQSAIFPMPKDNENEGDFQQLLALSSGFSISVFIVFGMAFLTTMFIYFLIKEREVGAKHMQIVSGVGPLTYWIPTLLWDFINYIVPSLLLLVVFAAYSKEAYIGGNRSLLVILVLAVYGWAVLPFMYAIQFAFKSPPTGIVLVIMLNIVSGLVTTVTIFILRIPAVAEPSVADSLNWIFMALFPNYNMAQCFGNIYTNYLNIDFCTKTALRKLQCQFLDLQYEENYLSFENPGIGYNMIFLLVQGFLYMVLVLLIEYHVFQRIWYMIGGAPDNEMDSGSFESAVTSQTEDSDVAAERQRVNASPASVSPQDSLLLVNLFKRYGTAVAVDQICVGVPEQECFGLLGQNGAGKTTTFKMLTGDVMVTGGNAYLKGYDVRNQIKKVQANMGYCPQFDALIDQMTGRETLTMYARLRGVPENDIRIVVNHLLDILMLKPHADKMAKDYSGGNKRKLSTAVSLVGDPPFIMLDEPSSGMDPKARRQLWNVLSQVRASGRTLVLTSHSMEECDALCTRIAIMVNGRFKCLGSPQHLKNKFGQGYTLIVKLGVQEDGISTNDGPVREHITKNLPGAMCFDSHQSYLHFQVPDTNINIADVFELMENAKNNLNVEDYSVSQTTLEQVFLTFTRQQIAPREVKKLNLFENVCCFCCIAGKCYK